jgi:hypothetical protein
LWFEETEVYATIYALLHEAGMFGKGVVLAVLEDEHTSLFEHALVEYQVGQFS